MHEPQHPDDTAQTGRSSEANRTILILTGLSLAMGLMFASVYPTPLIPAVLSQALLAAALATGIVAVVLAQKPFALHLNLWDKALILTFGGMVAGSFIDPDAITAFIEANNPAPANDATLPAEEG